MRPAATAAAHTRRIDKTSEFIGVVVMTLAWALQKVYPLKIATKLLTTYRPVGLVLILAATLILRLVHSELAKYKQPHEPGIPTTCLVTTGPFRYSRNPTYGAILGLLQPGLAITFGNVWVILLLPLTLVLFWYLMLLEEENYLALKFREEWDDYCIATRRWI